jgi:hypothetical protein
MELLATLFVVLLFVAVLFGAAWLGSQIASWRGEVWGPW